MKKSVLLAGAMLFMSSYMSAQNVGIGVAVPDASAKLDITSTTSGILIPRMTTAQRTAITSPATGLLVFDISLNEFWYYDGTIWTTFGGGGGGTLDDAYDFGGAGAGRAIIADAGAVDITSATANGVALLSRHTGNGIAVGAISTSTTSPYAALESQSVQSTGTFANPVGAVFGHYDGTGDWSAGILGQNNNSSGGLDAHGVLGIAASNGAAGIYGTNGNTTNGFGAAGLAYNGVFGQANNLNGSGVIGQLSPGLGAIQAGHLGAYRNGFEYAVFADNDILFEQYLDGAVAGTYTIQFDASAGSGTVLGMFSKGGGTFKIDHPLDPENKYLYHSFVESPDMMNIYNGIAEFDANGKAIVELPEYFEALNRDFRYQLTAVGAAMPNLYVAEEIQGNTFVIAGGVPNAKVSWQVTGVRQDKFANENRVVPEVEKEEYNKGRYLHPTLFDASREQGVHLRDPEKKPSNPNSTNINRKSLGINAAPKRFLK